MERVEMFLGITEGQASEGSGSVRVCVQIWVQSEEPKEPLLADGQKLAGQVESGGNCPVLRLDGGKFGLGLTGQVVRQGIKPLR